MRTVTYGGACSLDGFLAGPAGEIDWLHFSKDVEAVMAASWASTDTVLVGRRTWEGAGRHGGGGAMKGIRSVVCSRTIDRLPAGARGTELVRDAGAFVRELKTQPGRGIMIMGGGNLAGSLFEAGAIDEVALNVHPVLLGSGVPAFVDPGRRVRLDLAECRQIDGGCVLLRYAVRR